MTDSPQPDQEREEALRAAIDDLAKAAVDPDSTEDELTAAMEAVRQVPVDTQRMLDALRVPDDAGEYEPALRSLLSRIPDGWGRWIDCGPGWYPILARLEECLREIDPEYQVRQIKEKFGTLRFYWASRNLDASQVAVADAESESARTCERCGNQGDLRRRNGWSRTLCDDCAASGGYGDLPPEEEEEEEEEEEGNRPHAPNPESKAHQPWHCPYGSPDQRGQRSLQPAFGAARVGRAAVSKAVRPQNCSRGGPQRQGEAHGRLQLRHSRVRAGRPDRRHRVASR